MVDDSVDNLWVTRLVLERQGYDVLALVNCEDLLERIKTFKPRVIFMDHLMPGVNGMEATRLIKVDPACKDIPVVYFSAQEDIRQLALDAGADDWLSKPFRVEDLRKKVEKYLQG